MNFNNDAAKWISIIMSIILGFLLVAYGSLIKRIDSNEIRIRALERYYERFDQRLMNLEDGQKELKDLLEKNMER